MASLVPISPQSPETYRPVQAPRTARSRDWIALALVIASIVAAVVATAFFGPIGLLPLFFIPLILNFWRVAREREERTELC